MCFVTMEDTAQVGVLPNIGGRGRGQRRGQYPPILNCNVSLGYSMTKKFHLQNFENSGAEFGGVK